MFDPKSLKRWKDQRQINFNHEAPVSPTNQEDISAAPFPMANQSIDSSTPPDQEPCTSSHPNSVMDSLQESPSSSQRDLNPPTFQELLLKTIQSHKMESKNKKTKVARGSEVITSDEVYNRLQDQKRKKEEMENLKEMKKARRLQKKQITSESKQKKLKKKKKVRNESSSDTEGDYSIRDSDEAEEWETLIEQMAEEQEEEDSAFKTTNEATIGDWAIIKFLGKGSVKYFVGELIRFEHGDPLFKYFRKASEVNGSTTFKPPPKEDYSQFGGGGGKIRRDGGVARGDAEDDSGGIAEAGRRRAGGGRAEEQNRR
ncbi:hypothetical protein GE061_000037 [Apolygus lucorum]|uniref:Uncharacterized protein n=1 Tax=Apolygus lucorum TaxID=248454 RepID=A0A8S9Y5T2_APOLU|nr:hypothetical protein GE061_000037 [Apolygus lucorum]